MSSLNFFTCTICGLLSGRNTKHLPHTSPPALSPSIPNIFKKTVR